MLLLANIHAFFFLGCYYTATKLKHISDVNLAISIPGRGESSELLNDGDKNDYDWWVIFHVLTLLLDCICLMCSKYKILILTVSNYVYFMLLAIQVS